MLARWFRKAHQPQPKLDGEMRELQMALGSSFTLKERFRKGLAYELWLAEDRQAHTVLIKALTPWFCHFYGASTFGADFHCATSLQAKLSNPVIGKIFASGSRDRLHWVARPLLAGPNLRDSPASGTDAVIALLKQVTTALADAHALGLVHGGLKPKNIFITAEGAVVTDFGVPYLFDSRYEFVFTLYPEDHPSLPGYQPWDARRGGLPTQEEDLYSLGVIAFEQLAHRHPFQPDSGADLLQILKAMQAPPPSLAACRPDLPEGLISLVDNLLENSSGRNAQETLERLDSL